MSFIYEAVRETALKILNAIPESVIQRFENLMMSRSIMLKARLG